MARRTMTVEEYRREIAATAKKRGNKYHAEATIYDDIRYDSKLEACRARVLDRMQENGEILWWTRQVPIRLGPDFTLKVDFLVVGRCRQLWCEECKGVETPRWKDARIHWEKYGPCSLRVIFKIRSEIIEGGRAK